jgi:type II secretory pathway component GspD/PulD (secretin)
LNVLSRGIGRPDHFNRREELLSGILGMASLWIEDVPEGNGEPVRVVLKNNLEEETMQLNRIAAHAHRFTLIVVMAAVALAFELTPGANAQTKPEDAQPSQAKPAAPTDPETVRTFFLTNSSEQNDFNDIQTAVRNMLPGVKIYGVEAKNAINIKATPEDMEIAQKLIADLDQPQKRYRLTYTITDAESGKRTGSQQFTLLVTSGERSTFKQGSRVPIVTGTFEGQPAGTQVQYQDIGLNIQARVSGSADALNLQTKIELSSLAEDKPVASAQDPIVRQTVFDESSQLSQGKPMVLGSVDLPGTTRSQEIAVVAELVR